MATQTNYIVPKIPNSFSLRELNALYHNRIWDNLSGLSNINSNASSDSLKILHHNIRSITKKIHFYQSFNLHKSCDIISVSETWLTASIPNSFINLQDFSLVRSDRNSTSKSRAGGSAIYIKSNIEYSVLTEPSEMLTDYCDSSVWLNIKNSTTSRPTIISSIYLPPDANKHSFIDRLTEILSKPYLLGKNLIILGDFNINWNFPSSEKILLEQSLQSFDIHQQVQGVTFVSHLGNESLLDLNFVSKALNVRKCTILTCDRTISDHYATYLIINKKHIRKQRKLVETRNFSKFNMEQFYYHATKIPFLAISQDKSKSLDEKVSSLDNQILSLLNIHAPIKTTRVRGTKNPWLSKSLLRLINLKNKFYKRVFKSNYSVTSSQIEQYHKFKTFTLNQIRKAKKTYYSGLLSKDTKSFFHCIKSLTGKSKAVTIERMRINNDETTVCEQTIAEHMNTFFTNVSENLNNSNINGHIKNQCNNPVIPTAHSFEFKSVSEVDIRNVLFKLNPAKRGGPHQIPTFIYQCLSNLISIPLTLLLNETLETSIFPNCLKIALVTPVFKKGCREDPSNYRPISSLPIISKIFERIIKDQLMKFLEEYNLLNNRQFGFRKNHSTEQMLQSLLQIWRTKLDSCKPCYISAVALDIKKAFDSVNHSALLNKLPDFGLSSHAINLLTSYLENRKQILKINKVNSSPKSICSGVPQGSILGPLLFIISINDLLSKFPTAFSYADDTVTFAVGDSIEDSMKNCSLQLHDINTWYLENYMTLNFKKTQLCVFSNRKILSKPEIHINGCMIKIQDNLNILGITLDPLLTFSPHIKNMVSKANKLIHLSSKLHKFLNVEQAIALFKSIVRPTLEYCPSLLLHISSKNSQQIEKIQNRAIRIILSAPKKFSITTGRALLNLPTLKSRRQYLFNKFIKKKLLKGHASRHLLQIFSNAHSHNRTLRSSHNFIKPYYRTNTGQATFLNICHSFLNLNNSFPPTNLLSFSNE